MTDTSWIEIDLLNLRRNVSIWRNMLRRPSIGAASARPSPRLCAIIKADAYGMGAGELARCYDEAGVDMLAVYSPGQANEILQHPIRKPILVLMPVRTKPQTRELREAMLSGQLHLSIDSPDQLIAVQAIGAATGARIPIHLSIDTGMSRGGLSAEQFASILHRLTKLGNVRLSGVWTHFAAADRDGAFTQQQYDRFQDIIRQNQARISSDVILHAAATHAALRHPRYHLDMVRIGLGLLGYGAPSRLTLASPVGARPFRPVTPFDLAQEEVLNDEELDRFCTRTGEVEPLDGVDGHDCSVRGAAGLMPAVRWRSRVVHVRRFPAGSAVGYGCTAQLARESYLGIVPVGYADGYPLALSNKGVVTIVGRRGVGSLTGELQTAPVVGRVNMDQIIVDLTDLSARQTAPLAQIGDTVELISPDPASPCALPKLASLADSSPYEMLCRISPRVPRLYVSVAPSPVVVSSERMRVTAA